MLPSTTDTIVALSSAPNASSSGVGVSRAIVRLSGPKAFEIARTVFQPYSDSHKDAANWLRVPGVLKWRTHELPAEAYQMPGPRSYTRQDIAELHTQAPRVAVEETLTTLVKAGARAALPGEFTRRALLNGRIGLAQAEALGLLLRSEHADQARVFAARLAEGSTDSKSTSAVSLSSEIAQVRERIEDTLALLELGLDFSQEDVEVISRAELEKRIAALIQHAQRLVREHASLTRSSAGLRRSPEPRVVLCGAPNAGKSSLFNALLDREAALVSPEIHTTRDMLEADFSPVSGIKLQLVDTAGIAVDSTHTITQHAQAFSHNAARTADILLLLFETREAGEHLIDELASVLNGVYPPAIGLLQTKADLCLANAPFISISQKIAPWKVKSVFESSISSQNGSGLKELKSYLGETGLELSGRLSAAWMAEEAVLGTAIYHTQEALGRALQTSRSGLGEDALAVELREALHALSETRGILLRHDALTESLLDRIFSQFCIGK